MVSNRGRSGSAGTQWCLWSLKVRRFLGHSGVTLSHPGSPRVPLTGIHRQQSAGGVHNGPQLHVIKQLCCLLLQGPQGGHFLAQCLRILSQVALQPWGSGSSEPGSDFWS